MKSKVSHIIIVIIAFITAVLYLYFEPKGDGFFAKHLFEILFFMNAYLIFQLITRRFWFVSRSRVVAVILFIVLGFVIEIIQYQGVSFLGNAYHPLDILAYAVGVGAGFIIDAYILDRFEDKH